MDAANARVARVERAICEYLQSHPHAVDTERGICEWWLRDARPQVLADDVRVAIRRLASTGRLLAFVLPDGQLAYSGGGGRSHGPH
jgi:hypothetical protein